MLLEIVFFLINKKFRCYNKIGTTQLLEVSGKEIKSTITVQGQFQWATYLGY